jgi:apolipoprotein N-acyltransferase
MTDRLGLGASGLRGAVLSLALGILIGLGQEPYGLWPVSIVALSGVFLRFHSARSARVARAQGFWTGFGYALLVMVWITEPFLVDAGTYGWMAPFGLAAMAAGFGVFWSLGFWGAWHLAGRPTFLGLVAGWTGAEMVRSVIFTGLPWGLVSHIWIGSWPYHWASLGGPYLVQLMTFGLAGATAHWIVRPNVTRAMTAAGLGLAMACGGLLKAPTGERADAPVLRLVQPNAPQHLKWDPEYRQVFFDRLLELSAKPGDPDAVIWPEVAVTFRLDADDAPFDQITRAAGNRPVVLGGLRVWNDQVLNALLVLDQDALPVALYDKHHLVPFGEYAPGGSLMRQIGLRGLAEQLEFGFVPGPGPAQITLPNGLRALPMICYEAIFPHELRRAGPDRPDMMLHLTNDAWFGQGAGPAQHLAQTRARAIEFGLPVVRVANTGISAMIDVDGSIRQSLHLGEAGWLDATLPLARESTLYWSLGDNPTHLFVIVLGVLAVWRRLRNPIDPLGQSL